MPPVKILIMGLPGSGKTTLAHAIQQQLVDCQHLNADVVRKKFDDWDFSPEGRLRQAKRMADLANISVCPFVIADFVAPVPEARTLFNAYWTIWMDTISESRYEDTNKAFIPPDTYDFRITEKNSDYWAPIIAECILKAKQRFNPKKPTVQMLGRWQPWHAGHRALFERAIKKTGQVCIMIRDTGGNDESNPFDFVKVKSFIEKDLNPIYEGLYEVRLVPNIVNITYGRDVGYAIERETFDESISNISATQIRKELVLK
jgi:adenylylsulfate kinase